MLVLAEMIPEEAIRDLGITRAVDQCEAAIATLPPVDCPVEHIFTIGLYIRKIFMPAGTLLTSKIHNTEHPFVVLSGVASVWTAEEKAQIIQAPYLGITKPGTRRVIFIHEDCVWATFHPRKADETTVEQIEERIIMKHDNPFLIQEGGVSLSVGSP